MMRRIGVVLGLFIVLALKASGQTVISNVYVSTTTATTATIVWTTSTPATSLIRYGYNNTLPYQNNTNYALVTSHSMTLTVLNGSQPYFFAVVSVDGGGHTTQSSTYQFALCGGNGEDIAPPSAGTVPVTGTVNFAYGNGAYTITWNAPSGAVASPTVCGHAVATTLTGTLNTSGSFNSQVADSLKVTPGPGTWTVHVADPGNIAPISTTQALSVANQDVSAPLQAAAVSPGLVQVTATGTQCFPSWVCVGSGGGGVNPGANYAVPQYSLVTGSVVGPSNLFLDTLTGNNLLVGASGLGSVTSAKDTASVNRILSVIAPPYNALCDGTTDDTTAIQAAFTDAYIGSSNPLCTANGCSVQFPAGICVTGTIVWKGQPFFGAGITATTIQGKPGQDGFQIPDGVAWTAPIAGTLVRDLRIKVDTTVDASASGNKVVSATVTSAGSGGTDGTQIVTGTTGVGGLFKAQVTVSGGVVTAVLGIYNSGFYTTNPTNIAAEPVTGAGLIGATLNLTMGSAGGNNTFPNRIAGTLGGASNTISPAISPGPEAFGPLVSCSGTILGGSLNTITFSGPFCPSADTLQNIDPWRVVGAPITINGVGAGGNPLYTTIASVTGPQTITLTTPATSSGSSLSGSYLNPVTPPYYFGNCGISVAQSNGSAAFSNVQNFQFRNIQIIGVSGPNAGNHACGVWMQAPPYEVAFDKVQMQNFWGGYIEARPATNPNGRTWTGDTSSYKNIDFQIDMIPMIIMQGNHRTFEGINVYGGAMHQALGPMWLEQGSSASVSRMYFECTTTATGEISRYTGFAAINIAGGGLDQCNGANSYVLWNAAFSTVAADVRSLQLGSSAIYNNMTLNRLQIANIIDNGFSNSVTSNGGTNPSIVNRVAYMNRPRPPVGLFTGDYLGSGNAMSPYLTNSDLIVNCTDMGVMFNQPTIGTCISDPTGTELSKTYFQSAGATTVVDGIGNGGVGNIWANYPRVFGTHIPQGHVNVFIRGECVGASSCTARLLVKDGTTNATLGTSGTLTFGSTWTTQFMLNVDLTGTTAGDQLSYRIDNVSNAGTNYNIASINMEPINADTVTYLISSLLSPTSPFNVTTGSPVILLPQLMNWGGVGSASIDLTSPTGYSWTFPSTGGTYSNTYNGSFNYQGGLLFPSTQSVITYTMNAPPVWTDTLNGSLSSGTTTCVLTTGALASWNSDGYFLVDQEILGYTGSAPSPGTTSFTCTRGNFGTLAEAHSNGAAVSSVPTAQILTKCNGNDVSTGRGTNIPILPQWDPYSQPFEAQQCNGYNPNFNIFATTGPTGQTYKLAAITISSLQGILPTPTAANQVLMSSTLPNGAVASTWSSFSTPITLTTTASVSVSGSNGIYYNQDATAAAAITYTLPAPIAGAKFCFKNDNSGGTPDTGTVKILTNNIAIQQISCFAGCSTSAITVAGFVQSAGAAGDGGCVVAKSTTEWDFTASAGTWAIH